MTASLCLDNFLTPGWYLTNVADHYFENGGIYEKQTLVMSWVGQTKEILFNLVIYRSL